jgi:hypothetical protein
MALYRPWPLPFAKGNGFTSILVRIFTRTWFYLSSINISGWGKGVDLESTPLI